MPANTPRGYPYPLGTDRVMDGDDAIHNLATAIDTKLGVSAVGLVTHSFAGANQSTVAVTFPAGRFVNPPVAVLQSINSGAASTIGGMWLRLAGAATTSGFTSVMNLGTNATNTFSAFWHAVEQG
jgi:hypothetical protein